MDLVNKDKDNTSSLFKKITIAFAVTTLSIVFASTFLFFFIWNVYTLVSEQWNNWELADTIARQLRPQIQDSLEVEEVNRFSEKLSRYNPTVELILLDRDGQVLFPSSLLTIAPLDTSPLRRFIRHTGVPLLPIFGDNPFDRENTKTLFSTASTIIAGQPGYIYAVLGKHGARQTKLLSAESLTGKRVFLFFLSIGSLSAIIGIVFFRILTKRFRSMTEVVESFAAGDFSRRIAMEGNDEIGLHAKAFNSMANTIESNIEQLERIDSLRRELISNVSHDLRLPISVMQTYLETIDMKLDTMPEDKLDELLQEATNGCESLNKMISDLFELSKLNASGFSAQYAAFSLSELIESVVSSIQTMANKKLIDLKCNLQPDLPTAWADARMIERAIANLTANAVRYTPTGGKVEVSARSLGDNITITISDTGEGMSEEEIEQIFERFYRTQSGKKASDEGTGLGLAIVKRITELHSSKLSIDSSLGTGSDFSFTLEVYSGQDTMNKLNAACQRADSFHASQGH